MYRKQRGTFRHAWRIGDDGGYLVEVDAVEGEGDVLQGRGVGMLGVDLQTHTVVGLQLDVGMYFLVEPEEEVVVLVEGILLVPQHRTVGDKADVQAAVDHLGLGTDAGAQLVGGIVIAHTKRGAALLQDAVEECVEDELRILLVVAYPSTEG